MAHPMTLARKDRRTTATTVVSGVRALRSRCLATSLAILGLLAARSPAAIPGDAAERVLLPDSIREIPASADNTSAGQPRARIVRAALKAAESDAAIDFEVALRMRNFAELQARVARGEIIPREEMSAKYLPLPADYERTVAWLAARGLAVTHTDSGRLSIFVRGTVRQIGEVFQTNFARVAGDDGEVTSAITAPSVPTALATAVLGVNGLQPHVRPHKFAETPGIRPFSLTSPNAPPYLPSELLRAYGARGTNLTGVGQTIAIVIDTFPLDSDLTTFWSRCGITQQSLGNIQKVVVVPGATLPDPSQLDQNGIPLGTEAAIDAELTSALAPNATIRIYATSALTFSKLSLAYQSIYDDLPAHPDLRQVNLSYGIAEALVPSSQLSSDAQHFAALAAAGVTVVVSSGDGGSNPDQFGRYSSSSPISPAHPASDPSVTGVGATYLVLDPSSGATSSETAWSLGTNGNGASGGAPSTTYSRPVWQTGTGVPSGGTRLVPDVAVVGDPRSGAYIVNVGSDTTVWGGTSISAPIWSGFCALLNQARANAGLPPFGLLGPWIYPLIGTTSFRDITSGSNGAYNAGSGYDLVTGVGTPNVSALVQAIAAANSAPTITAQPASQTVAAGQNATFTVTASGSPAPTYSWQRQPAGSTSWSPLTDASPYNGIATATLTVSSVTNAMSGDSFRCVVTNAVGSVTSAPAALMVASPLTIVTLAGTAGLSGTADGTGAGARFRNPSDVAVDAAGNVFVADTNNNTIREITPAGVVTTLAGLAGTIGNVDGTGSAARFYHPSGIAVDASGTIFVADTGNLVIRRITPAGAVTTLTTSMTSPSDVAPDGAGNLYVACAGEHTIRKVAIASGTISLFAGFAGVSGTADGTGTAARFNTPEGVAVDAAGNVYVADTNNHTIREITPAGVVGTLAGAAGISGSSDGVGSGARFQFPADLTVDRSGNLYVVDTDNHTVRKMSLTGATATVAGLAGAGGSADGAGSAARFYYPTGIAVDSAGNIYVADTNNHTVRQSTTAVSPAIQTQPVSQSVTVGSTAQFSVVATGTPAPTYQWNFNGTAIAGATSATLTLSSVQSANAGTYTVVVTNAAGSVTSSPATLTVTVASTPADTGGGGGGGGGGEFPGWFVLTLLVLEAVRRTAGRRQAVCRG